MFAQPLELNVPLTPAARFDVIDVRARLASLVGDVLDAYPRCLYCSLHTTAGFLDQSLASRLGPLGRGVTGYVGAFRALFPEGAGYRHDDVDERPELTIDQRPIEPKNADSHLAFIAAGLATCVTYRNRPATPVSFVDLDGVLENGKPRQRQISVVCYGAETEVAHVRIPIPVSRHLVDSVNLKDPRLGLYDQVADLVHGHGVDKGRIRLSLAPGERHAGLTVNEYETFLMRHDLIEALRDPLRFVAEKGWHVLADPRAIPTKTLGYAKYDLVRAFNEVVEALGLSESLLERVLARAIAMPAERFLRMKRRVNLLVSDHRSPGRGAIIEGTYQSPILVQWRKAPRRVRHVDVTLLRFT